MNFEKELAFLSLLSIFQDQGRVRFELLQAVQKVWKADHRDRLAMSLLRDGRPTETQEFISGRRQSRQKAGFAERTTGFYLA
ncbi:hypothetical protein [Methylosarcina fibrata]|uniref:hypothetical protein n=1 Tax=Methylosarcina fibrata TaxID=105972 RepID=UPI00039BE27E|nr:hypothetical protein [Methylosarcina fibrata]